METGFAGKTRSSLQPIFSPQSRRSRTACAGKKAAANADFKYSDALKNAGFVWDGAHLDEWLEKPQTYLPGTKMSFAGLKDGKDRTDLIAYLMVETGHKAK